MTTHTPAPAHEAVLTDDEIIKHLEAAGIAFMWVESRSPIHTTAGSQRVDTLLLGIRALLSKLRAPVADEHETFEAWRKRELPWTTPATLGISFAWDAWQARAALASAPVAGKTKDAVDYVRGGALNFDANPDKAPVAGEAVAEVQIDPHSPPDDERAIIVPLVDFEAVDAGTKLYAAPQASEAVLPAPCHDLRYHDQYRVGWNRCLDACRAALSAQPGAQKEQSDA